MTPKLIETTPTTSGDGAWVCVNLINGIKRQDCRDQVLNFSDCAGGP